MRTFDRAYGLRCEDQVAQPSAVGDQNGLRSWGVWSAMRGTLEAYSAIIAPVKERKPGSRR